MDDIKKKVTKILRQLINTLAEQELLGISRYSLYSQLMFF